MSSKEVAKTVSKKLKYYLDVKRREDAFDLSGPYLPKDDPMPLRAGPTLAYDGIHDRSLKHYFHHKNIKQQLQHMTVPANMHKRAREKAIRHYVDETMASVDYRLKAGPVSPYAFPQAFRPIPPPHRPKALRTVDEYLKTRRGSKRRKTSINIVGKPRRITRRSPPQHVHKDERERIVNMASKLIVATETVALPQQKKQSKGFQATEKELPRLERRKSTESSAESAFTSEHESESSINGRTPHPPKKREKPSSASHRRPQSSVFKSSCYPKSKRNTSGVNVVLPGDSSSDNEKMRYLMDRMNLDGHGTSVMASPREHNFNRPKSAAYPLKSTANTAVETDPNYSDDDFCSEHETPRNSAKPPRVSAWSGNDSDMVDMCTQTVVHSATQTKFPEPDEVHQEREVLLPKSLSWTDKEHGNYVTARPPVAVATTGASTSDVLTSTSNETQTRNTDLEPKVITYEVYVQTGDRLGAGSKVNVKITLFGEYGNSGERQLLRSRTNRNKFQRGQVDVFAIDSLFLGKLRSIRIGHNETRLGYGWFLDKVYIKEGVEATRSFEFRCNRWLSSRDDDGQIMRDLPVYDVVPASHVDAILPKEHDRDYFFSPGDSDATQTEGEESPREAVATRDQDVARKSKKKSSTKSKRQTSENLQDEIDGFKGTTAENLFDFSDDEEEKENRFFEPEEEYESDRSEDEHVVDRKEPKIEKPKPPRYQKHKGGKASRSVEQDDDEEEQDRISDEQMEIVKRDNQAMKSKKKRQRIAEKNEEKESEVDEEISNRSRPARGGMNERKQTVTEKDDQENSNNEEEEEEREEEEENGEESAGETEQEKEEDPELQSTKTNTKPPHSLRVITTAISPFLKHRQPESQPSTIPEETPEEEKEEMKKTKEIPENVEEDDEPAVEFTPQEEKKPERPSSAKSDEYEEGFRAGIRKKQEEERKRHRASISESENVLKSGQSIHDAAKGGNLVRIKELIQVVPAMKNAQDERGMTPLHLSASNGHLDCVKWLAVSGVDLADETPTGYTAMHLAAMNGHVNCMMILAAMGSAINTKTIDALTPLHLASMSGHIECVKWLLANRAYVDVEDNNGRTPYDIAEDYGHEPIIKLLKKFRKELKKQDSTLAQLMKTEKRRKSVDSMASDNDVAPSKVSDSGVGGMESEEENWISDREEDVTAEIKRVPADEAANRKNSLGARDRPDSASRSRTDSIVSAEEKKKMFEQQRQKMKKRHSSFLDSIRQDVDNEDEF